MNTARLTPQEEGEAKVLIIDDDAGMAYTLARMAQDAGHLAETAASLSRGLPLAASGNYDVLFLDVRLPDGSGIDAIPEIQASPFPPEIIIITAYSDRDGAQMALKSGVWDYIEKPARIDTLKLSLKRALQYRKQKKTNEEPLSTERNGIIGESANLLMCITLMAHAAKSDANVIISGETGTGKELFARAIHTASGRCGAFVPINCAALPDPLLESELFGYVGGAFTGGKKEGKPGLFETAKDGTVFLDEIAEMSLASQAKLLRLIQEGAVRRIGGTKEIPIYARIITATNKNLERLVEEKKFRQDLYYRVSVLPIHIPPLNQRLEDIPLLVEHFLFQLASKLGAAMPTISRGAYQKLRQHDWPGNIRELKNVVDRAAILCECETIDTDCIFFSHEIGLHSAQVQNEQAATKASLKERIAAYEQQIIVDALKIDKTIRKTARTLKISHPALIKKMRKYKIRTVTRVESE
jgi:transcriptional regulator of aroF, aroG, tyrA and aromatic amino acid transport